MRYEVIFIDWDGTLSVSKFWNHVNKDIYDQVQEMFFTDTTKLDSWMRGAISSENFIKKHNSSSISNYYLLKELQKSAENMKIINGSLELIQKIRKQGVKVVIATDNMDTFHRWTIPSLQLENQVDGILSSYQLKKLKKETGFFTQYLRNNKIHPNKTVLIDDSIGNKIVEESGMDYVKIETGKLIPTLESFV